jgi:O-antigen ligase
MLDQEQKQDRVPNLKRSPAEPQLSFRQRIAKILDKIIFFCLLAVAALAVIPYGTVDAWWDAVFEILVFGLAALWIFEGLLFGKMQLKNFQVLLPLVAITAYAFLQTVFLPWRLAGRLNPSNTSSPWLTIDRYQTQLTSVKMLALTLFTTLLLTHITTRKRLIWTVRVVIGVGLGSSLFGLLRQVLQSPDAKTGFVLPFLYPNVGYAQFLSTNVFAFLVEMSFALLAGLVVGGGIKRKHILIYVSVGLLIWVGLVLSNSRGVLLGFAAQAILLLFVALAWFSSRRLAHKPGILLFLRSSVLVRILVILLIMVTLMAGVLWMGGDRLASKLTGQTAAAVANPADGTTRKEIWASTWQIIKHRPWTGVGFGTFFLAIPQYQIGSGKFKVEQAHNDYLDLAASGGVIAVLLAAWFIGAIIWRGRSSLRSSDEYRRAAALGALAGVLSVAVHSVVDFGLQISGIAVVFAMLVVISIVEIPHSRGRRLS